MSITRTVTVHCDGCDQWTDGATHSQTVREARHAAWCAGWVHERGRDLCPDCTPAPASKGGE